MKKFLFFILALLLIAQFSVPQAFAHILKTDGDIGAIMHIDPDDNPAAGKPATFFFEIKDKTGKLDPQNCQCRVDIYENGKIIYSDSLFQNVGETKNKTPFFQYTFPKRGIYEVKLIGNPSDAESFQPFTLSYAVRVDKDNSDSSQTTNNANPFNTPVLLLFLLSICIIVFITASARSKIKRSKTSKN